MSIFLLHDPECVLIHIPKTGGTSIRKGVWEKRYEPAIHGKMPKAYAKHFKFAFVRHPFDRFVSVWKMFADGAIGDEEWSKPQDAKSINAYDVFNILSDPKIIYDERRRTFEEKIKHHGVPQTDPFNCLQHADFVGRFETLDADFEKIAQKVGIDRELPKMHFTKRQSWQDELPEDLLEPLYNYYRKDFETLGYDATPQ